MSAEFFLYEFNVGIENVLNTSVSDTKNDAGIIGLIAYKCFDKLQIDLNKREEFLDSIEQWRHCDIPILNKSYEVFCEKIKTNEHNVYPKNTHNIDDHLAYYKTLKCFLREYQKQWDLLLKLHGPLIQQLNLPTLDFSELLLWNKNKYSVTFLSDYANILIRSTIDDLARISKAQSTDKTLERIGPRQKTQAQQDFFLQSKQEIIDTISSLIAKGKSWEAIYNETCQWRSRCADIQLDPYRNLFGEERLCGLESPVTGCNGAYLEEKIKAFVGDSVTSNSGLRIAARYPNAPQKTIRVPHWDPERSESIELTTFIKLPKEWFWLHTRPDNIPEIMNHVENIYKQIRKTNLPEEIIPLVASMHWWFCHACPCTRGSAAIMEILAQAIFDAKKIPLQSKKGILIDIEALSEPNEKEFIKNYRSFYI